MNTELRFYLIDSKNIPDNFNCIDCTDDEFIELCEEKGEIYSLVGFEIAFNTAKVNTSTYELRAIEVPTAEQVVNLIDQAVYSERVTFQDILDGAPSEVKERYEALSEEDKKAFVKKNFHGCKTGFEFGICDPISDIYSTLRSDLEF